MDEEERKAKKKQLKESKIVNLRRQRRWRLMYFTYVKYCK